MKFLGACGPSNPQGPLGNPEPASQSSHAYPLAADDDVSPLSYTAELVISDSKCACPHSPSFYIQ